MPTSEFVWFKLRGESTLVCSTDCTLLLVLVIGEEVLVGEVIVCEEECRGVEDVVEVVF